MNYYATNDRSAGQPIRWFADQDSAVQFCLAELAMWTGCIPPKYRVFYSGQSDPCWRSNGEAEGRAL